MEAKSASHARKKVISRKRFKGALTSEAARVFEVGERIRVPGGAIVTVTARTHIEDSPVGLIPWVSWTYDDEDGGTDLGSALECQPVSEEGT